MNRNPSPLRTSLALLLPCLLLIASPGFAEDDEAGESFGRRGWYLAVNAVGAFTLYRDRLGSVENSVGLDARVGYRATPFAAMEAELGAG